MQLNKKVARCLEHLGKHSIFAVLKLIHHKILKDMKTKNYTKEDVINRLKKSLEIKREAEKRITEYWIIQGYNAKDIVSL